VVSVVRWAFIGVRATYLVCKDIIKAFMAVSGGNSHENDLDEEPHQNEDLNPYQILGVEPGLSSSELNARYRQLMSANHPDKVAQLDPEIQAFASERSRRIIEAYEAISAGEN
jgi:preprotein translocase subunit Sec63